MVIWLGCIASYLLRGQVGKIKLQLAHPFAPVSRTE